MYSEPSICKIWALTLRIFLGFQHSYMREATHIELFMDGGEIGKEMLISLDNIIHGI